MSEALVTPPTFLEIGPDAFPAIRNAWISPECYDKFRDTIYIAIDKNLDAIVDLKNRYTERPYLTEPFAGMGLNHLVLEDLKMPPGSVDEVYMANVIGEYSANSAIEHALAQLPKLYGLLKPEGQLTIVESATPPSQVLLAKELLSSGFTIERIIEARTEQGMQIAEEYSIRNFFDGYAIIARKPSPDLA